MLVLQKGLILPVPMYGGSYFFIQPKFCESLIYGLHRGFTLAFTLDFLDLTTFLPQIFEKNILLNFLPHFTTAASGLYHSRYGFWQIHFRHLVLHMRLPVISSFPSAYRHPVLVQKHNVLT